LRTAPFPATSPFGLLVGERRTINEGGLGKFLRKVQEATPGRQAPSATEGPGRRITR
jgi:hypothetical protein